MPHDDDLFALEWAGLFQESNRNSRLPDIVQQSRERQFPLVLARKAEVPAECHGYAGHEQTMLVGQAMMMTHDIDPAREPVRLDMGHDRLPGRLDHIQINGRARNGGSEDALQSPDPRRDAIGASD
jgi:hypothetical protein